MCLREPSDVSQKRFRKGQTGQGLRDNYSFLFQLQLLDNWIRTGDRLVSLRSKKDKHRDQEKEEHYIARRSRAFNPLSMSLSKTLQGILYL